MHPPRPVPRIGQHRQSFAPDTRPPIRSPMELGQPPQQPMPQQFQPEPTAEESIAEQVQDMAMEIYARLAAAHISRAQVPNEQTLMDLAKAAQDAALAYFRSLGIQFDGPPKD